MFGIKWAILCKTKNGVFRLRSTITNKNVRANLCARKGVRTQNSRNAWNSLKRTLIWSKSDYEHFLFSRALTRERTRTRALIDLKLTGRILTIIVINMNEKWFTVMKIWSWVDSQSTSQNGAWMTSRYVDELENVPVTS